MSDDEAGAAVGGVVGKGTGDILEFPPTDVRSAGFFDHNVFHLCLASSLYLNKAIAAAVVKPAAAAAPANQWSLVCSSVCFFVRERRAAPTALPRVDHWRTVSPSILRLWLAGMTEDSRAPNFSLAKRSKPPACVTHWVPRRPIISYTAISWTKAVRK